MNFDVQKNIQIESISLANKMQPAWFRSIPRFQPKPASGIDLLRPVD